MMMSSSSVHLVVQKGILLNQGTYSCNHFANPISGYTSWTSNWVYHPIHLQLHSKKGLHKYLTVFAKTRGNDDSQGNNRKTVTQKSESNFSSEKLSSSKVSNPQPEEDLDSQSVPSIDISYSSCNHQLYLVKLKAVLLHVLASEQWNTSRLKMCHTNYLVSATNLIHYLALHCLDVQQLADELSSIGLLNLESANSYVLACITSGIHLLDKQASNSPNTKLHRWDVSVGGYVTSKENENAMEFSASAMRTRLSMYAAALLGTVHNKKDVHIMVTVGKEAVTQQMLLSEILKGGATIIRINCAHDDSNVWSEIITQVKHDSQMLEKPCRVLMDLAGPKLRTGFLKEGANVMKISPKKDTKGNVIVPAQVWLSLSGCGPPSHVSADAVLFVQSERFLRKLEVGDSIRFADVRGRQRSLKVSKKYSVFSGYGYTVECTRTSYVESGTRLHIMRKKGKDSVGIVVNVPAAEQFIRLRIGDLLTIQRDACLSTDAPRSSSFSDLTITCNSGRLFDSVKTGESIAFDDGKIWGVIQGVSSNEILVSITHAGLKGSKLGSGKSINIPESAMQFEGLTSKDLQDLEFVAGNADMVGISFIRDTCDVDIVMQELAKRKLQNLGVVLKIETKEAFEKLPLLLLQAMRYPNPFGVMIARGDLAVECGWDQMASIQEEILSVCKAAHVPVIWATQVLESLVKSSIPTRAEITDVSSGMRANCIMLNKGKYIVEAVSSLDSILRNGSTRNNMKTLLKPLLPSSS